MHSGFERKVAAYLEELGVEYKYEHDILHYVVPETKRRYIGDFTLLPSGAVLETKGRLTSQDRSKMLHVIEQNPDRVILMLFQRDNTLRKGSKTKYTDWARKHGIICAVSANGTVPEAWLRGEFESV